MYVSPRLLGRYAFELTLIDPVIYPWFEIYPGHVSAGENGVASSRVTCSLQSAYPHFDICRRTTFSCYPFISYFKDPAVYPYFDIYRTGSPEKEDQRVPLPTMLSAQYPMLSLCEFYHHFV